MPGSTDTEPPGYPREWEADILLTDGGVAHLRPIKPSDAERLIAFYDRVSPESKYLRFFAPYPRLSERDVKRFTQVDYVDRVAFIVTLGEEMIAVGRYDRIDRSQAEVAFLIEDAHHGRGIAQLLLEHLAQAARERGITGFVAEVLPQNRAMAQVFADAGYRMRKGIEDGVLAVEFPILPTDTSVGVMERREHRAERASMQRLLSPSRVALYGGGGRVQGLVNSMLRGGYRGEIVAVASDGVEVSGVPTAETLAAITGHLDLALVSVRTAELAEVVIDVAHKEPRGPFRPEHVSGSAGSGVEQAARREPLPRRWGGAPSPAIARVPSVAHRCDPASSRARRGISRPRPRLRRSLDTLGMMRKWRSAAEWHDGGNRLPGGAAAQRRAADDA